MAQKQTVKFVKVPRERINEILEREKIYEADRLYIGESGTIYFVSDYETPVDFNNKILYNNNIKEEKVGGRIKLILKQGRNEKGTLIRN